MTVHVAMVRQAERREQIAAWAAEQVRAESEAREARSRERERPLTEEEAAALLAILDDVIAEEPKVSDGEALAPLVRLPTAEEADDAALDRLADQTGPTGDDDVMTAFLVRQVAGADGDD